jgi:hypothetical protein
MQRTLLCLFAKAAMKIPKHAYLAVWEICAARQIQNTNARRAFAFQKTAANMALANFAVKRISNAAPCKEKAAMQPSSLLAMQAINAFPVGVLTNHVALREARALPITQSACLIAIHVNMGIVFAPAKLA